MPLTTTLQTLDRGPGGFGHDGRGFGHHMGAAGPIVFGVLVLAAAILLLLAWRRDWFGSSDRRRRQFDEWHRLAHAGPVPTGPSTMPWPTSAPAAAPAAPATPPAGPPAGQPADPAATNAPQDPVPGAD
jgi:hypothetical protein